MGTIKSIEKITAMLTLAMVVTDFASTGKLISIRLQTQKIIHHTIFQMVRPAYASSQTRWFAAELAVDNDESTLAG